MVKLSYYNSDDQHDQKVFRESLGTFGTTTNPTSGQNQLQQLQAKIREGVKHVELALGGAGKGNFGALDVPDKYGHEQRRTIMQLAKLNNQTLSVHATFNVSSFSGIGQGGIDQSQRLTTIKEIDETISFAAETAKGGAVVVHLQGDMISNDKSELNLSSDYIKWLEKYKPEEFERIKEEYFDSNPLNRKFINNPLNIIEAKEDFNSLEKKNITEYNKYVEKAKQTNKEPWEVYYTDNYIKKQKLSPDRSPLIMVGDKIGQTKREQDLIDTDVIFGRDKNNNLNNSEKELLKNLNFDIDNFNLNDYQRMQATFTNGMPKDFKGKISESDFNNLKNKLLVTYEKVLSQNYNLQAQADKEFHKKMLKTNLDMMKLQKDDLDITKKRYSQYLDEIDEIKTKERRLISQLNEATNKGDKKREHKILVELNGIKSKDDFNLLSKESRDEFDKIAKKNQSGQELSEDEQKKLQYIQGGLKYRKHFLEVNEIGQLEFQKLDKYNEMMSQLNEQEHHIKEQLSDVKGIVDETFDKNISAISHLGIKALRYQLDLKQKSVGAKDKINKLNAELIELKNKYENSNDPNEQNKLNFEIQKLKTQQRNFVGLSDYNDIDLINNPLYIAPENMLPGMGSITSIEEFKAAIRMGQQDFAKRILGNEPEYKKLKEEYEKETGLKINTQNDAIQLAKRHLAGTFDNAHAAAWLKHFRAEKGESEEHKIDRFNKWLNKEAEDMVKEGLVKHIHFNDTLGKDDDHNSLGSGILDIHDLRDRLRNAGVKEALIVEAGGRAGHISNAFDFFNPTTQNLNIDGPSVRASTVSDWISVDRNYQNRPQYSHYGLNYNTFRQQPQQGQQRGEWSGTSFF